MSIHEYVREWNFLCVCSFFRPLETDCILLCWSLLASAPTFDKPVPSPEIRRRESCSFVGYYTIMADVVELFLDVEYM